MRTDSKTFSLKFIEAEKQYILDKWGKEYINPKIDQLSIRKSADENKTKKTKKNKKILKMPEAIRPTDIYKAVIDEKFTSREKNVCVNMENIMFCLYE